MNSTNKGAAQEEGQGGKHSIGAIKEQLMQERQAEDTKKQQSSAGFDDPTRNASGCGKDSKGGT